MSLINKIKEDQIEARKARFTSKASLLTTLLGEASIIGKNAGRETTDEEVVAVVKKFIKNIDECLAVEKDAMKIIDLQVEKTILNTYLPKQLAKDEMLEIITALNMGGQKTDMKGVMQHFKQYYAGQYDGKVLSEVTKEYLAVQV